MINRKIWSGIVGHCKASLIVQIKSRSIVNNEVFCPTRIRRLNGPFAASYSLFSILHGPISNANGSTRRVAFDATINWKDFELCSTEWASFNNTISYTDSDINWAWLWLSWHNSRFPNQGYVVRIQSSAKFCLLHVVTTYCWKDENKKKENGNGPIKNIKADQSWNLGLRGKILIQIWQPDTSMIDLLG